MSQDRDVGFFSRWSRRKVQARQGEPLPEPPPPSPAVATAPPPAEPAAPLQAQPQLQVQHEAPPPPTVDDVAALQADSDFRPFVASDVQPEVKNAALKKLFSDPHYNVMDGLDTYIDDYSQPDPLPPGMLEKMAQSAFLGLFTEAPAEAESTTATTTPDTVTPDAPTTPEAAAARPDPDPSTAPHENSDLRLQPDDAAERPGLAESAGGHAGREP